jgi:hypothetical protein
VKGVPVLYVAGPYRDRRGEFYVRVNIRLAERVALKLWRLGAAVICPHKNTAGFGGVADDSVLLLGDIAMLELCHAVVLIPRWRQSSGACAEYEHAVARGIPTFEWPSQRSRLIHFIQNF